MMLVIATMFATVAPPVPLQNTAPQTVSGDAQAGLVSSTASGEVHLIVDPQLHDRRVVLRIVVLNKSKSAQDFGPASVELTSDKGPVAVARPRDFEPKARADGGYGMSRQAYSNPTLPVNGAGQKDVTGFTGSMSGTVGGVPSEDIDRAKTKDATPNPILAAMIKPMKIAPGAADGGLLLTEQLKRGRTKQLNVAINFAGQTYSFQVKVPR